jgi:hypothetical protein
VFIVSVDSVAPRGRGEDRYVERIQSALSKTVEGILEAGRALIEAKAELHHGSFEHLVKERCPFSTRTARMLMAIASHQVLSNRNHGSDLPASWRTLYELSKFEPRELEHALSHHWIKPDMPRKHVPNVRKRVRVAIGLCGRSSIRVAKPARPVPFAQRFRRLIDQGTLEWLAGLDEVVAEEVAKQLASRLEALHHEAKTAEVRTREFQKDGTLKRPEVAA